MSAPHRDQTLSRLRREFSILVIEPPRAFGK
jgi:hypothetical protein